MIGARPLKRVIQKNLQDTIAELVLEGAIKPGDMVKVTADADGLRVNGAAARKAA